MHLCDLYNKSGLAGYDYEVNYIINLNIGKYKYMCVLNVNDAAL